MEDINAFVGPLIPLYWTSGDVCPGFQSQDVSIACMLSHLHAMDSSDSPLVQPLLTSSWPARQPSLFNPYTCRHVHKHSWSSKPRPSVICIFLIACKHSFCNTFLVVKCLELRGEPLLIKTLSLNRSQALNQVTIDQSVIFPFLRHFSHT